MNHCRWLCGCKSPHRFRVQVSGRLLLASSRGSVVASFSVIPYKKVTLEDMLTKVAEFYEYVERVRQFAAQDLDVYTPDPGEA